jgi:hypothetical protein
MRECDRALQTIIDAAPAAAALLVKPQSDAHSASSTPSQR